MKELDSIRKKEKTRLIKFWNENNIVKSDNHSPSLDIIHQVANIFNPGKFYYFIFNFYNMTFEYVHPTIKDIIGCNPDSYGFDFMLSIIHPEDLPEFYLKENAAGEFFYKKLSPDKRCVYKASYHYRFKSPDGSWHTILHQSLPIQLTEEGRIHRVICVHTDISFLKVPPDKTVTFISLEDNKVFYSNCDKPKIIKKSIIEVLTKREQEIINFLCAGLLSKQVAVKLNLSVHTIDTHRRRILRKLNVKNTTEAVIKCVQLGITSNTG